MVIGNKVILLCNKEASKTWVRLLTQSGISAFLNYDNNFVLADFKGKFKAELPKEGIFFLIHLFARDVLVMKKMEIKKLSPP